MQVEQFLWFLNKVSTIATSDRGTPAVFEEASFVASYAWNSALIDGTDIIRSFPAIGHILQFPIGCDPTLVPTVDYPSSAVVQFLLLSSPVVPLLHQSPASFWMTSIQPTTQELTLPAPHPHFASVILSQPVSNSRVIVL